MQDACPKALVLWDVLQAQAGGRLTTHIACYLRQSAPERAALFGTVRLRGTALLLEFRETELRALASGQRVAHRRDFRARR